MEPANINKEQDTENKILTAASKVFMINGKAGASMQNIADEAGINRTLLHYYFRSKDKLFDAIFNDLIGTMFPVIAGAFMQDIPLIRKFEIFAESYVELLKDKPFLPFFIFQEILLNPDRLVGLARQGGLDTTVAMGIMKEELKKYGITDMDPRHLIANLIGMVIFPFVGRPVFEKLAFNGDVEAYNAFLEERKKEVPRFIRMALSVNDER
ncbi:MAG: TetR/AcrR family transcriptional regulator [Bacteroidales bacterium]|nr:TetR/AcrR family transcriptional regulator [Bacteroidales bacterium]